MGAAVQPIVEAAGLVRCYQAAAANGARALDEVDLRVDPGEYLAVTGPSGCGKSTLLNLLAALDSPDQGSIRSCGLDLTSATEEERTHYRRFHVGIVFQFFHLLPGLTVEENVAMPLRLRGEPAARRLGRARDLLDYVGLAMRLRHLPHQLSGGEMQRVAVARAMVHGPQLVIADEPTGNLDTDATAVILALLHKLHRDNLATLVVVTHSDTVAAAAGRRIRMRDGRITEDSGMHDT